MSRLLPWVAVLLLVGCTVDSRLGEGNPRAFACDADRRCGGGWTCIQGTCQECKDEVIQAYRDQDGDGHAEVNAVAETFCGTAPSGYATARDDCDDANKDVHPGAPELCDGLDNDCQNGIDDGLPQLDFYRDDDGDGVGAGAVVKACGAFPGLATIQGDCDDQDSARAPGKAEVCDGKDNNCDGILDEGFIKGATCTKDGNRCSGVSVCSPDGLGTTCDAPSPVVYHPDADGDGEGSAATADNIDVCPSETPPAGAVTTATDCDDRDARNRAGGTEVCDDRDNNCAHGKSDEAVLCGGKGWKQVPDFSDVGIRGQWHTVAVGPGGYPVWVAGEDGALAVRQTPGGAFIDYSGICGNTTWWAAWVRPKDGAVYLAGDYGKLAMYQPGTASCRLQNTANAPNGTPSDYPPTVWGIIGFGSTVYVVNDYGNIYAWTPGSTPVLKSQRNVSALDIHGVSESSLLVAGYSESTVGPVLLTYNATGSGSGPHTLNGLPGGYSGPVTKVWAMDATHAYAVGDTGLLLKRSGNTTWDYVNPDTGGAYLTGVVALDDSSVFTASHEDQGAIRRFSLGKWTSLYSASDRLDGLAVSERADKTLDIWAVGHNNVVVHFPE